MTTAEGKNSMFSLMTRASVPIAVLACVLLFPDVSYAADPRSTIEDLELSAGEGEGTGVGVAEEDGEGGDGTEADGEEIDSDDVDVDDIDLEDMDVDDIDDVLDDPRYFERIRRLELSGEYLRWVIHNGGY